MCQFLGRDVLGLHRGRRPSTSRPKNCLLEGDIIPLNDEGCMMRGACVCDTMLCERAKTKGITVLTTTRCHRTMRLISLCVTVFAAEIQTEQDTSKCLFVYA